MLCTYSQTWIYTGQHQLSVSHRTQTPVSWVKVHYFLTHPPTPSPVGLVALYFKTIWRTAFILCCLCLVPDFLPVLLKSMGDALRSILKPNISTPYVLWWRNASTKWKNTHTSLNSYLLIFTTNFPSYKQHHQLSPNLLFFSSASFRLSQCMEQKMCFFKRAPCIRDAVSSSVKAC